ncbi:MAG: PilZ domain-containing protein [Deltaproteobacteria bacterium]|nr:PilZ domain-containing protein [Deltaproteobacteria bacterium]
MSSDSILERVVEELLELELRGVTGDLDEAGQQRWEDLSRELFGVPEAIAEKRRYVRVQVSESADLIEKIRPPEPIDPKEPPPSKVEESGGPKVGAAKANDETAKQTDPGSSLHEARVLSLSAGGLFLETDRSLKTGDEIEVALRVPHPEPLNLSLRGEIRWVSEQENGRTGAGVRFVSLDDAQRAAISSLVRDELLQDLRLAVEKSRFFFEASPDATVLIDRAGILRECNERARDLLGVNRGDRIAEVAKRLTLNLDDVDRRAFSDALAAVTKGGAQAEPQRCDLILPATDDGRSEVVLEVLMTPVHSTQIDLGLLLVGRDITARLDLERQRHRLEERLRQTDKLATLGRIAAGIAHDINNPLSWMSSNLELVGTYITPLRHLVARALGREEPKPAPAILEEIYAEMPSLLQETTEGSRRIQEIVRDLHGFSRLDSDTPEPLDLNAVVEATLRILDNTLRQHATLVRDFGELPITESHFGKLSQIFLNLLTNAARAFDVDDSAHNVIMLRTRYDERARAIVVCIEDNGRGIPEGLRHAIFEPLFTTHRDDGGTGLGLSIARNAARTLGARLTLTGKEGEGSKFCLHLPLQPPKGADDDVSTAPAPAPSEVRARLLIVDDEVLLLRSLKRHLQRFFEVVTAEGVVQALEEIEKQPPDVVLCDVMMPDGGGRAVYEGAVAHHEALGSRFIFMTGGTFERQASEFLDTQPNLVVRKPLDLNLVAERLSDLAEGA